MTRTGGFLGDWLVSEYLYTPAGEYVGVVRQRRRLQPREGGEIRVIQQCEPVQTAATLSAQAQETAAVMNRRVGEFLFDLQLAGRARHYLGPDVIGGGFSWHEGALTARGLWPRFGCNFTSFSLLLHPERQVTGGRFYVANQEIATIVGAAVPEAQGYPEMVLSPAGGQAVSADYRGHQHVVAPDGRLLAGQAVDGHDLLTLTPDGRPGRERWYGPLREVEAVTAPGETFSLIEIHDHAAHAIAGLGRRFRDEKLHDVTLFLLTTDQR